MKPAALFLVGVVACGSPTKAPTPVAPATPATPPATGFRVPPPPPVFDFGSIPRLDFNRLAAEHFLPLFWRSDANHDGALQPDELVGLWGWGPDPLAPYVAGGQFTRRFIDTFVELSAPPSAADARHQAILLELAQGRPTLVESDFTTRPAEDRAIVDHVVRAAGLVERLYARQNGVLEYAAQVAADDPASRMVFLRNQGPACAAPRTEQDPACSAIAGHPKVPSGLYPAAIQTPGFCERLAKQPNAATLVDHFTVVVDGEAPGTLGALPYSAAYRDDMEAVAVELEAAAHAITSAAEQPFAAYLTAAAHAFRTNDWETANEAWAAMGTQGSAWYLRIGADEVYHDPCALKAGFHVSFARINPGSLAWRQKLEPVKDELEAALAKLAGAPYRARPVKFKLPDFIDMILNAGDSRNPTGATIGESLPNWGKVAARGGRTVAMTNLYTDADSADLLRAQTAALFCPATEARVSTDPAPGLMSTVLHEAAHNLGPAHEYKVGGKVDDDVFGGTLAAMMEELKAQTAALYLADWLAGRAIITQADADTAHVRDVAWAFGHIAQGMYAATGTPKTYSQLAAIQLGALHAAGVLAWKPAATAANGTDHGCFELDLATWKPAVDKLARRVLAAKAKGDRRDAEAMKAAFVDGKAPEAWAALRATIAERWLRAPKASFVYAIRP